MAQDAYVPPDVDAVDRPSIQAVAEYLSSSRASLLAVSPLEVCRVLGEVHAEWADPHSNLIREAVEMLARTTGYARATIDRYLRTLFKRLSEADLKEWLRRSAPEGVDLSGPPLIGVVAAGNLPGTAIPSLVQALLLRSACLVKSASAEPYLMPLYAHSIACRSPELARAMAVLSWPREDDSSTAALLEASNALIAYGSDATLDALQSRFSEGRLFIHYGHRISFSVIGRGSLTNDSVGWLARNAAWDMAMFDQQGCLSPQAIYVQRGGEVSPAEFGELLAKRLEQFRTLLPRHPVSPAESAAIHQYRAEFELRSLGRRGARLWQSEEGTAWTVALDPDPALRACPLNRTAVLHPFDSMADIEKAVSTQRGHLISCGWAAGLQRGGQVRSGLKALGVTRFCRVGHAQLPTSREILLHDGVNALRLLGKEPPPAA